MDPVKTEALSWRVKCQKPNLLVSMPGLGPTSARQRWLLEANLAAPQSLQPPIDERPFAPLAAERTLADTTGIQCPQDSGLLRTPQIIGRLRPCAGVLIAGNNPPDQRKAPPVLGKFLSHPLQNPFLPNIVMGMKVSLSLSERTVEEARKSAGASADGNVSVVADAALKHFLRLPAQEQRRFVALHRAERAVETRSDWMQSFWQVLSSEVETTDRNANPMAPRHLHNYVLVFLMNRPDEEDHETDPFIVHAMPDPIQPQVGAPRNFLFHRDDSPADAAITVSTWLCGRRDDAPTSPRSMPNAYDAFNFIDIQKKQLVAAYDALREPGSVFLRQALLNAALMALGSFKEAVAVLCGLNPSLMVVRDRYADDLERWSRMRNDVVHVFQLVFGPPRKGTNSPWIPGGLSVGVYTLDDDTVRTGSSDASCIRLSEAISTAVEISTELEIAHSNIPLSKRNEYVQPIAAQIATIRKELAEAN